MNTRRQIKFDTSEKPASEPRRIEANTARGGHIECPCQVPAPELRIDKAAAGRKILRPMAKAVARLEAELEQDEAEAERLSRIRPKRSPAAARLPSHSQPVAPVVKRAPIRRNRNMDEDIKQRLRDHFEREPTPTEIDAERRALMLRQRKDFLPNLYDGPGSKAYVPPPERVTKDNRPVPLTPEQVQEREARRGWMPALFKPLGGPPLLPPELTAKPAPPAAEEEDDEDQDEPEEKTESEGERLMRVFQEKLKETKNLIKEQDEAGALRGGR